MDALVGGCGEEDAGGPTDLDDGSLPASAKSRSNKIGEWSHDPQEPPPRWPQGLDGWRHQPGVDPGGLTLPSDATAPFHGPPVEVTNASMASAFPMKVVTRYASQESEDWLRPWTHPSGGAAWGAEAAGVAAAPGNPWGNGQAAASSAAPWRWPGEELGGGKGQRPKGFGKAQTKGSMFMHPMQMREQIRTSRWHKSAESVGVLSQDDHVFTKVAGPKQQRCHESGKGYELSTICMVFDASLRCSGVHQYNFTFMEGELGPADGAGFIFDTRVRRRPLQQMRAVFLNQRGSVCLRRGGRVSRLPIQLPRLTVGMNLTLSVDLDWFTARFDIANAYGEVEGSANVGLESLFIDIPGAEQVRSGFFGAVVTGDITVGLY